jgi:two-component system, OmpR family, phosphate regulon sensor histidine kinase PhoR
MIWRLFITYMVLVVLAVSAFGIVFFHWGGGQGALLTRILAAATFVLVASVPGYLLARNFTRQLEHEREQLRTILSGLVEGVVAIDNESCILFANDRAGKLLDFDPTVAVGRKFGEVNRQRTLLELLEKALAEPAPQRQELDYRGSSIAIYASRLSGGSLTGAVMVLYDVTDLRRLERLRQDFVANVSHELKTPLANIKSSVEVLMDGAVEDPNARGMFLEQIAEQSDRQQALIEDLLSLARIESSEHRLECSAVHVEDAVYACIDRQRTRAEAKGLTVDGVALAGSPGDLCVWADEQALSHVLDNLVDNAVKYTPQNGRVTVRWQAAPETVRLEVEDTGIGIPERDLPRVFERFYRVDKARSRDMGGTGLGLAIVKHLVGTMKGQVHVKSELNRGTTFTVLLPRADRKTGQRSVAE